MNTMMNAEIASDTIKSRSHTPNAGRSRAPASNSGCPGGGGGAPVRFLLRCLAYPACNLLLYTDRVRAGSELYQTSLWISLR